MKKVVLQSENMAVLLILVLSFFPWLGLISQSGMDITLSVVKNITSLASIEYYGIAVSVIFAAVALLMAVLGKANRLFYIIAFAGLAVAFVFGMIDTGGSYLSSMDPAYIAAVIIGVVMLLKTFGIIKLKF